MVTETVNTIATGIASHCKMGKRVQRQNWWIVGKVIYGGRA